MSVLHNTRAAAEAEAADVADRVRCSCLPFSFWRRSASRSRRTESRGAEAAHGKRHRRRRFRFRIRLSWLAFSWPWLRKKGGKKDARGKQRRGRRLLLLLKTSLQAKNALASVVVSGDRSALLPATVSSFGDAKKPNRSKPRLIADGTAPSGTRQPQQASRTATGTSGRSTAPARPGTNQPCTTATDEPDMASAGRMWRAPSRRHTLQQPVRVERPVGGLWTAATTLGVIVLFARVTAVFFLCSCLYGARFVRERAAGAGAGARVAKSSGVAGAGSSRRFGDPIGVAVERVAELCVTEECKKKVVMAGLLERPGKRPSSRFGR